MKSCENWDCWKSCIELALKVVFVGFFAWGVMNAPCGNSKGSCFYVPDPWSFDEKAFPKKINNFLALPRYFAKNYISPSTERLIINTIRLLNFVFFDINIFFLTKEILYSIYNLIKFVILSPSESYQNTKASKYLNILYSSISVFTFVLTVLIISSSL